MIWYGMVLFPPDLVAHVPAFASKRPSLQHYQRAMTSLHRHPAAAELHKASHQMMVEAQTERPGMRDSKQGTGGS